MKHSEEYLMLFYKIADVIEELHKVQSKVKQLCIEADKEENSK